MHYPFTYSAFAKYREKLFANVLFLKHRQMDFSQTDFIYRAEGNANLVLYLPQYKKVLRLPKSTILSKSENSGTNPEANKNILDVWDHVAYMHFIIHLFGSEYTCRPEVVSISSDERDRLNRLCAPFRPAERLDKEFCGQFGLLLADATFLPNPSILSNIEDNKKEIPRDTFAIEIKPKQGWMIQDILSTLSSNLFDLKGLNRCRYCCMQLLKLKQQKIQELSTFCPMDIFSGNVEKMKKALDALFQFPQNNLRVFKNGILCYGDYKGSATTTELYENIFNGNEALYKNLIIDCLLKSYDCITSEESSSCSNLPKGCVLESLLKLQFLSKKNINFMSLQSYEEPKSYYYLPELIRKGKIDSFEELTPKEKYQLGATAMDSSIMISFSEVNSSDETDTYSSFESNFVQIENKKFVTQVKILDIDPKSDNHFQKYLKQTNEAYCETFLYLNKNK